MSFIPQTYQSYYCVDEGITIYAWSSAVITECINNVAHQIAHVEEEYNSVVGGTGGFETNGSGDVMFSNNVDVNKCIRVADIAEPSNPGAGFGYLYKKTGADAVCWKSDTLGEKDLTLGTTYGHDIHFFSDDGPSATSSASYVDASSATTDSLEGGCYRIGFGCLCNSTGNKDLYIRIYIDSLTVVREAVFRLVTTATTNRQPIYLFDKIDLTDGIHTIDIQFKINGTGQTLTLYDMEIEMWRII